MAGMQTVEAIILRIAPFKEHDLRVVFFTRAQGLGEAVATGARKPTSKQRSRLACGTLTQLTIASGRRIDKVTTSEPIYTPKRNHTSLAHSIALQFFLGCVQETMRPGDPHPELYVTWTKALCGLDEVDSGHVSAWCDFVAECALRHAGYAPNTTKPLGAQMEHFFEKPIRSFRILSLLPS